jgi:hypothetical protein
MKSSIPNFRIIWRTSEELSKFNKTIYVNHYEKILFFIYCGFQSVFLMGARDYVKPVSSHEAVFVGSTFPKDLQRYNQSRVP